MTASLTPDLCVIGAGLGGLSVARGAAALGAAVVLVEKGEMGARRLNSGGLLSKALNAAGHTAFVMRLAGRFGIKAQEPWIDYPRTRAHLREVIAAIAPNQSAARLEAMNIKVIHAAARFTSPTTAEAGGLTIRARRFVIATGSSPAPLPFPGLEQIRSLTTDSIFDLETLPTQLIVVGAQSEGLELGQAFRRLGCEVTILDAGKALADEDSELSETLLVQIERDGVVLRENAVILRVEPRGAGVRVVLAGKIFEEPVDGSHLLIATARTPNVEGLGLEAAGVAFDKKGIKLGRNLRSSNRRIYAVGDVAGAPFSAHSTGYQASRVLRASLMGLSARMDSSRITRVTFTDPEIAVAGLSETEARRSHGNIRVLRWPFAENDRARAEHVPAGHVKVILSKHDIVLGAGIVGPHAGELIGLWHLAICKALKVDDIADLVMPYPTLSEVSERAAAAAAAGRVQRPWTSRLARLMRAFG